LNQVKSARTLDAAQSQNKETVAGMPQVRDVAPITRQEDYMLDSNNHSTQKTPTNKDAATETNPNILLHSSAQVRIPVKTSKQGVVYCMADDGRVSYLKRSLNVTQTKQYCGLIMCIFFWENLSLFPACTEDNIRNFLDRLNLIHQEVPTIGKATFETEIVSAFNHGRHTSRGQLLWHETR
jgi:hypothetical protein